MSETLSKKRYDFNLKKPSNSEKNEKTNLKNVFGDESDSDDAEQSSSKKLSASEMFNKKYSSNKAQRLLEKTVKEDPSIFEYDEVYDQFKEARGISKEHQKADEERKPKYVESIMKAHKRRELQKLIHDEHVYKKEREAEAGQFDDKEAYVTESYRKKIIERNTFREEVERQDALDDMVNVKDQKLWQQAFQRQLLDNISRMPAEGNDNLKTENLNDFKVEDSNSIKTETADKIKTEIKEEEIEASEDVCIENKNNFEQITDKDKKKHYDDNEKNYRRKRSRSRDRYYHSKKDERNNKSLTKTYEKNYERRDSKKSMKSEKCGNDEKDEIAKRMDKICKILARRNTEKDIEEAKERFFERQSKGIVVPPIF